MQAAQLFVGLDIGGTKTAVLLVDSNNHLLGKATLPTRAATPDELLATIARVIHTALTEAHATPLQIESIGMGVPGQVDPATGIVQMAVNLNLQTYRAEAAFAIENEIDIPDDSALTVSSEGLLGGNFIEIIPGASFEYMQPGDEFLDTQGSVSLISLLLKFVSGSDN